MNYREIKGDLISLTLSGEFEVCVQGVNCFCVQKSGLAPQMVKAFKTNEFSQEAPARRGDINKLGTIDYRHFEKDDKTGKFQPLVNWEWRSDYELTVVNAYTQFNFGANHQGGDPKPLDYSALTLCMKKINRIFAGKKIGLPKIGAGLARGDWEIIKKIIQNNMKECYVTIVEYEEQNDV